MHLPLLARLTVLGALTFAALAPAWCGAIAVPGQDPLKQSTQGAGVSYGLPFEPPTKNSSFGIGNAPINALNNIVKRMMQVLAGVSVLALIWAGYEYITSYGDEEKTKKAKKIVLWVALGLATGLAGWAAIDLANSVSLQTK